MANIIKSALYKLFKDWTFRITLIIGVALAVFMNLVYLGIDLLDGGTVGNICNGQTLFISSLSPTQNFGLTVPINLVVFTIGEFNCGTIRNKIIAGHKKSSIYLSMFLIGLIFTVSLMTIYFGLSVGIASAIGGFKTEGTTLNGFFQPELLYQYPLMALATYVFIVSFAIFIATLTRSIGGSMPLVIIPVVFLMFFAIIPMMQNITELNPGDTFDIGFQGWLNPIFTFGIMSLMSMKMDATWFIASLVTPIYWAAIFLVFGTLIFVKRDVK
ncbi:MAG: ABC transporter permease [Bacilli bacterium]|nr:ABC transporter permease [Bacilli bacterium]